MKNGGGGSVAFIILFSVYIYIRGVNDNALMHAINLKMYILTQINHILYPDFLPSSQCGRLSVVCDESRANQCNGTTSGCILYTTLYCCIHNKYFENTVARKSRGLRSFGLLL